MAQPRVRLAGLVLLVLLGRALDAVPAAAQAASPGPGPCHSCGGYNVGNQTTYGGTYHVRVNPPAGPTQGGGGHRGGTRDCSGIPLPLPPLAGMAAYRWPMTPMPCSLLTFDYYLNQGRACPDPAARNYTEFIEYSAFGRWVPPGRWALCLTAADFQAAGVAPPPGLMAVSIWRQMPFPDPQLAIKPAVKGLANLESYFWVSGPQTQARSVAVGPYTVAVTGQVVNYEWSWGDGTPSLSTTDPGTPWPGRSDVNHAYRQAGQFPVTVASRWHGTFTVNGGAPQDVVGPDIFRSSTTPYAVQEIRVTLTQ